MLGLMGEQIKESVVTRKVLGICVGEKRKQKGKYRRVRKEGRGDMRVRDWEENKGVEV